MKAKYLKNKLYKKLILTLIVLFILPSTYAILQECNKASFCDSSYNLTCTYVPPEQLTDGYCPEDYGNWNSCKLNSYGTKCFPCDPDCALAAGRDCGAIMVSMPSNAYPGENIYVNTTVYTTQGGYSIILKNSNNVGIAGAGCSPINGVCNAYFTNPPVSQLVASPVGGTLYQYGVYYQPIGYTAWGFGVTKPNINIEQPSQPIQLGNILIKTYAFSVYTSETISPYQGVTQTGRAILDITGAAGEESINKLTKLELYLYKEGSDGNYFPTSTTNCQINCNGQDCNLIARWTKANSGGFIQYGVNDEYFDYTWNSLICDNKEFKITAIAYDGYTTDGSASDDVYFTLNNTNAPCIENCPKVSTNLLNLIVSKIKVWL